MSAGDVVSLVACPSCGAAAGSWCVRHGRTQPGPLLCCVSRFRVRSVCPVSELAGNIHVFLVGTGVRVPWDVAGDSRDVVEVCAQCAGVEA